MRTKLFSIFTCLITVVAMSGTALAAEIPYDFSASSPTASPSPAASWSTIRTRICARGTVHFNTAGLPNTISGNERTHDRAHQLPIHRCSDAADAETDLLQRGIPRRGVLGRFVQQSGFASLSIHHREDLDQYRLRTVGRPGTRWEQFPLRRRVDAG